MKNKELFDRTIGILVNAYQRDMLEYASPCGCAVGSLCAAAKGLRVERGVGYNFGGLVWKDKNDNIFHARWGDVFLNGVLFSYWKDHKEGIKEIEATGYSVEELRSIEKAFMDGWYKNPDFYDDHQLNGLLSVYDKLCEIHQINKEETIKAELIFVR